MEISNQIISAVDQVASDLQRAIRAIGDTPVADDLHKAIRRASDALESMRSRSTPSLDDAKKVGIFALHAAHALKKTQDQPAWTQAGHDLANSSNFLKELVDKAGVRPLSVGVTGPRTLSSSAAMLGGDLLSPRVSEIRDELDRHAQLIKKDLLDAEARSKEIDQTLQAVTERIEGMSGAYDDAFAYIKKKSEEAAEIVGVMSGQSIAGNFAKNSAVECKAANRLRAGSIVALIVISFVIGLTLFQSARGEIDWRDVLTRLAMASVLTLPAGYLARESSKHRQQQYRYEQTSLELHTITPLLDSLPVDQQQKIKADIAQQLVDIKRDRPEIQDADFMGSSAIILELIQKLERAYRK